jgi:hypothetical protein
MKCAWNFGRNLLESGYWKTEKDIDVIILHWNLGK